MVISILKSRTGMGVSMIFVFMFLFWLNADLIVFLIWVGTIAELFNGYSMGEKTPISTAMTVFWIIYGSYSCYCVYRFIHIDWWGVYCCVQLMGTSDTAQYFVGKNFGSIRIFPASPKKSVEGYVGGLIFTFLACRMTCPSMSWLTTLFFTFTGMFGDFIASLWKRTLGIKDAGNIFASHGGFLDRFDSHCCLFVVLSFYYRFEQVIPYEDSSKMFPLYGWLLFVFIYFGLPFILSQKVFKPSP